MSTADPDRSASTASNFAAALTALRRQPVWAMVAAGGIVMGLALGVRHVQGLFLLPITMDRGWPRDTFALAMAVQNLGWGLAQPFAGMLADRFGSAKVIATGLVFYAVGLTWMAHAATPASFIAAAGLCIGIGLSGTSFAAIYGALSRLVPPQRVSWALGLAGAIGGFAQFAMVPLVHQMLGGWGWVSALLVLSAAMACALTLAFPMRETHASAATASAGMPMSMALREAFGHRGFWMLNIGFLACGFQLAFIATHLPSYLQDRGMQPAEAVTALALIALTNVLGTYGFGLLGARHRRKFLLTGIYLVRTAAMALFVLLPLSPLTLYAFAAAMGFLWLGTAPLTNGLVSQIFGVRYIGTLFGVVFLGHQLGSFLGVWLGGVVFEATRSYDLIWLGAMALGVVAAALHMPIDDREMRPSALAGARA